MGNSKSEAKKIGVKTGIPLDDDKLEMVSGGTETTIIEEKCRWYPNGKHIFDATIKEGRCKCGAKPTKSVVLVNLAQ